MVNMSYYLGNINISVIFILASDSENKQNYRKS